MAVIGDRAMWRGGRAVGWAARTVGELGALAEARGISAFWVHESALASLGLPEAPGPRGAPAAPPAFWGDSGPFSSSRGEPSAWSYWYRPGGVGFDLHIPAYGDGRHPFKGIGTAAELLVEAVRFYSATGGVRWAGTAAITSDVYLRPRLAKLAPTQCPPPVTDHLADELALVWHRVPDAGERAARYLHALDLNLAYAAAASSLELPTGPCQHSDWPELGRRPAPGLYLFDPGPWAFEGPPPYVRDPRTTEPDGPLWVTAPTAERMAAYGYEAIEAWRWPQHGRHLRGWYEMLRDGRTALLDEQGPAYEALKMVCRWGLGRMAADERRTLPKGVEYLEDDPTFRPYWAWAVIAETRCRLQRRVAALGALPVAVDTDALYFLASTPHTEHLGVELGLPIGRWLGQYRGHGRIAAGPAVEVLTSGAESPTVVGALRELVK